MPTSASDIIRASFEDLGIVGEGQPLTAEMGAQGLKRLNGLVSSLHTQTGTVTAVERNIFPLVADQQTYTIGLGGDFNVSRPTQINAAALWLDGLDAPQSCTITRTGYAATVTAVAHGFSVGDEEFVTGATQIAYNGLQTIQTVPTANTFTFTVQGTPVTPATGTITVAGVNGEPVEIPREVLTDSAYQSQQLKNLSNAQFTNVYYNPTFPFGTIVLWPRPDTADNQLILYLESVFEAFADLTTEYDFPDLPGYGEMLQYQLNLRLASSYARPITPLLMEMAQQSMGLIKRTNNKLTDLASDASVLCSRGAHGYNIDTDSYN